MPDLIVGDAAFVDAVVRAAELEGRAAALAAAARALATWSGVDLPESDLCLLDPDGAGSGTRSGPSAPARPPGGAVAGLRSSPGGDAALVLGASFEALLSNDARVAGAHHTPLAVAEHVVALATATESAISVCDPAVGGGIFLLAAAQHLADSGVERGEVLGRLWGFDRDPMAVAVAQVALALWAGGPAEARPHVDEADFLLDGAADRSTPVGGWDLIVGNPPFQSQLATRTARDRGRAAALKERFGAASGGYVDEAGLFALAAVGRLADDGRLALVLPASLLAAADADAVRVSITGEAPVVSLWVPDAQLFDAGVDVVVPVFARRRGGSAVDVTRGPPAGSSAATDDGSGDEAVRRSVARTLPGVGAHWADLLADAEGVPRAALDDVLGVVGDLAVVTAGFRQHFYAIAEVVGDRSSTEGRPVLTVGSVDPLTNHWGERVARLGGVRFAAPVLDPAALAVGDVRTWIEERDRPKLLVATQTRVVEAVADPAGSTVPSTPLISVEPREPARDLWSLLAVLCAPPVTAWLHRRAAGTGLSAGRIRVSATQIRAVPLPADQASWTEAATAIEVASGVADPHDRRRRLLEVGHQMTRAYGLDDDVTAWWADLLPTVDTSSSSADPGRGSA